MRGTSHKVRLAVLLPSMYAFALAVRERVDSAPDESGRTVWPGRDCALRFEDEDLPDDAAGAGISKIQLYVVSLFTRVWFSARGCSATWRCRVRASQTFPFPRRKSSRSGCCGSSTAASRGTPAVKRLLAVFLRKRRWTAELPRSAAARMRPPTRAHRTEPAGAQGFFM